MPRFRSGTPDTAEPFSSIMKTVSTLEIFYLWNNIISVKDGKENKG